MNGPFAVMDGEEILARFSDDGAADEHRRLLQAPPFPLYEGLRVVPLCPVCHDHVEAEGGLCPTDNKENHHDIEGP